MPQHRLKNHEEARSKGDRNMNRNPGILGKKIGMTQIFDEKGEVIRCTVIQAGCVVIGKRTVEKDGYSAIILGLGERKEKHTSKPLLGKYRKIQQTPKPRPKKTSASRSGRSRSCAALDCCTTRCSAPVSCENSGACG